MLAKILTDLGLSKKEATVYLSTLRTGSSGISTIAKRAMMSRSTTYNILHALKLKGFVKLAKRTNVQYFSPIKPQEIVDVLTAQKEELSEKMALVKTFLPQFEAIRNPAAETPKVSLYEGINGIKQVYEDILKCKNKETFAAVSLDNISPRIKKWLIQSFTPRKIKRKIRSTMLIGSKQANSYRKLDKKHLRKTCTVPDKKYPFEVEIDVYDGDKTAFISFDEKELMGVIVESPKIARSIKSLLEIAWDKYR
ncbi:MAG: helix-turn-helix domain-containing protein [Candidatus Gracilibacteria bacterium]|jgi:sugar-specific transcriptional regulator TrmB